MASAHELIDVYIINETSRTSVSGGFYDAFWLMMNILGR